MMEHCLLFHITLQAFALGLIPPVLDALVGLVLSIITHSGDRDTRESNLSYTSLVPPVPQSLAFAPGVVGDVISPGESLSLPSELHDTLRKTMDVMDAALGALLFIWARNGDACR